MEPIHSENEPTQENFSKWQTLYKKLRPLYAPSLSAIFELRELSEETRIGIIWDLFVISVAFTGGLDSRLQMFLLVSAKFMDVDVQHIYEFESKFALLAQREISSSDLSLSSSGEQELPEDSGRWWKIGLGAAVGGGLLIATGGIAAPVLLPAVGGLASVAAATAGAVGLGTLSASITVGSSTLIAGGVPLVAGLFGAAGASLTKDVEEFLFLQIPLILSPEAEEEQNLLNKIDKNLDSAVSQLTKIISHPQVLLDIYSNSVPLPPKPIEDPTDDQFDEMMTEFELLEDSTELEIAENKNIFEGCCIVDPEVEQSEEFLAEKLAAEQIVTDLERSLCGITEKLEEKLQDHQVLESSDSSKVVSVIKSPQCPPQMSVCICVCGWIWSPQDFESTWRGVYDLLPSSEIYSLRWESAELQGLGRHLVAGAAASIAMQVAQKYAMRTIFAATLSALALPASALQLSALIGHPWNIVFNRAKKCGKLLAW
eukprot:CAMPEP_0117062324 /NCGR_PEP_ID=MMETSP0472-20121206/43412_1 /TAXON_ID=693140 ORGANISM="Tiarina fusus, Strain LIS" /NCGR_SAMPLE_ID=MMETSP0472 /ASSEMBLY_ACC=CAM_ASM_000603 /LENGTH=484 /DNA_ID=CAMNT_0004781395 /DNA_START=777 /DNA_END=2228 /DNA_ORIENTATION=+